MTRKHFVLVAKTLRAEKESGGRAEFYSVKRLAKNFARAFAAANPDFDRARFMTACGLASFE